MKVWSSKVADRKFSKWILKRDKTCRRCGTANGQLQCSHFWDRKRSRTRYDVENCDAVCARCHYWIPDCWENEKQGDYMRFKIKQLGQERYDLLEKKAHTLMPRKQAILQLMEWLVPLLSTDKD